MGTRLLLHHVSIVTWDLQQEKPKGLSTGIYVGPLLFFLLDGTTAPPTVVFSSLLNTCLNIELEASVLFPR